jgi:hypothetical protein
VATAISTVELSQILVVEEKGEMSNFQEKCRYTSTGDLYKVNSCNSAQP